MARRGRRQCIQEFAGESQGKSNLNTKKQMDRSKMDLK